MRVKKPTVAIQISSTVKKPTELLLYEHEKQLIT